MLYAEIARPPNPTVSVIIPTLNEAENLALVLPRLPRWVHEVIIVDGHSTDGTVEAARLLRPDVRVVMDSVRGKGAALRAGFAAAKGDIIVMIDADGSTEPEEIGLFVRYLMDGADFVKGSRFMQGGGTEDISPLRSLGNGFFTAAVRFCFGGRFTDLCYGYSAFWSGIVPLLELDSTGFEIETLLNIRALRAGCRIVELPSFEAKRVYGKSNLRTFPDGYRVLKTILRERLRPEPALKLAPKSNLPYRNRLSLQAGLPAHDVTPSGLGAATRSPLAPSGD